MIKCTRHTYIQWNKPRKKESGWWERLKGRPKRKHLKTKNVRLGEPSSRLHMLEKLSYGKGKEQIFVKCLLYAKCFPNHYLISTTILWGIIIWS